jgi:hypothetical protein
MADKKDKKEEVKSEELDYTVWHPEFLLNHIYELKDGKKIYWTLKSMASEPTMKYVD